MPTNAQQLALGYPHPGEPGSKREYNWKIKYLRKCTAVRSVKTLWVHRSVRVQFNALTLFLQRNGAKLGERVDDWGWANRQIAGTLEYSYHRWALAADIDALENVQGKSKTTFPVADTREVCKLLGLEWGKDFRRNPDPMHFQFSGSLLKARWIRSRLTKPTKRSRRLAHLCGMPVGELISRIK